MDKEILELLNSMAENINEFTDDKISSGISPLKGLPRRRPDAVFSQAGRGGRRAVPRDTARRAAYRRREHQGHGRRGDLGRHILRALRRQRARRKP